MAASREEVLSLARTVLEQAGIRRSISSVKQLNSAFFTSLYNTIIDEEHQKLTPLGVNERSRLQMIIDSLKRLLPPQVSLSHINGRDISKGDLLAIKNLLEIFSIIFELPSSSSEDSNVLTGEGGNWRLKVVAEVIEEELNSSSVYIPTAIESLHSSLVTPPTHQSSSSDGSQSTLMTPPTNPLMSLDVTPTVSPTSHQPVSLPLDQSTPHKGPRSRLDTLDGKKRLGTKHVSTQRRRSQQTSTGKLMATVQDAFPELQLSPASERKAWHLRMRQLNAQSTTRTLPDSNQRKNADIERRHKLLLDTLKKELTHSQKMHNLSVKRQQEKALRLAIQTQRAVTARSRRYYSDYEVSIKKKLQRERTKEEQVVTRHTP
ncbi:PREDICTED: centrosomal protein of 95 kDa-like [Amphimedon queenslandica]|uniref:DUF5745 domain-containing protein n=1 Tax=Amphimedon queenslandica TaxID=400682 RepID=A0AAN0IVG8_AMPQE|nr:PREDICTED: centrosomal protein of 95 kDa-like [Amphimedon queenslandica]|eukprot:XP_011410469.1 PREDICTED: centrosomal protein of 95 kDa-like [Amphimedon queenslandica]